MPDIILSLSSQALTTVVDAFCEKEGYPSMVRDPSFPDTIVMMPNPQSRGNFAKECLVRYLRMYVKAHKEETSRKALQVDVDALEIT